MARSASAGEEEGEDERDPEDVMNETLIDWSDEEDEEDEGGAAGTWVVGTTDRHMIGEGRAEDSQGRPMCAYADVCCVLCDRWECGGPRQGV